MSLLKTLRESLGLTKTEMAHVVRMDASNLMKMEKRERPLTEQLLLTLANLAVYVQHAPEAAFTQQEMATTKAWLESERKKCNHKLHQVQQQQKALQGFINESIKQLPEPTAQASKAIHRLHQLMQDRLEARKARKLHQQITQLELDKATWESRKAKVEGLLDGG